MSMFQSIAVLGDGITAKAVIKKATELDVSIVPISDAAVVIASPGIPPNDFPNVSVPIISELDYAYLLLQKFSPTTQIIAVTGTNGKSTVTSLISHLIGCPAVGNIGVPFISLISPEMTMPSICVEVSSYQLETSQYFQSDVALLLNVVEDHLARHGTMANYCAQKQRLIENMTANQVVFYNPQDAYIPTMIPHTQAQCIPFITPSELAPSLPDQWKNGHLALNAVAGLMVAEYFGYTTADCYKKLNSFSFLPHRLEPVTVDSDRLFINDSKATNPHATLTAVSSCQSPIHLILCGENKHVGLASFLAQLSNNVLSITVFGDLSAMLHPFLDHIKVPIFRTTTLPEAVQQAYHASSPGDTILFSPSSSSYDQFNGFEDRGDQFKRYVQSHFCTVY